MPKVSVVIPCYNQGEYVDEAVDSVQLQTFDDYEIIIVNDGSTDADTKKKLESYNRPKTKVVHSENKGLPGARNTGIHAAEGDYILPLDADDRISPTYLEKAVEVLNNNQEVGVVTCKVEFFGKVEGVFDLPEYSLGELLCNNMIICSSVFRRSDWEKVGGYDPAMKYGWEDHEFWISLVEQGVKVERLPEIHFYYRKYDDSMADRMSDEQKLYSMNMIYNKHKDLYLSNMDKLFAKILDFKSAANRYLWQVFGCENQVRAQHEVIKSMDEGILGRDAKILELNEELSAKKNECESMKNSLSWRITSPLRRLGGSSSSPQESDENGKS